MCAAQAPGGALEIQSAALAFEKVPTGWQAAPNVR